VSVPRYKAIGFLAIDDLPSEIGAGPPSFAGRACSCCSADLHDRSDDPTNRHENKEEWAKGTSHELLRRLVFVCEPDGAD
jgi:hypothetical protein